MIQKNNQFKKLGAAAPIFLPAIYGWNSHQQRNSMFSLLSWVFFTFCDGRFAVECLFKLTKAIQMAIDCRNKY